MRVRHILATVVLLACANVEAQYFGQNRVKYDTFDFEILRTDHFDIYFYEESREAAKMVARMSERWYARHRETFDHDLVGRQILVLFASHPDFQQNNIVQGIGEGTGGVTESAKRRIVLPVGGSLAETDHVVGHELVHAFQYDVSTGGERNFGRTPAGLMPLWFIEGTAEYLSIGSEDAHTAMWMRDAVRRDGLPSARQLANPGYFPYRYGHAVMAFIEGTYGPEAVGKLMARASDLNGNVDQAIVDVLGVPADSLVSNWHEATRSIHRPVLAGSDSAGVYGRRVLGRKGELAVGPALSPDGSKLVYASTRSRLSIELFVADTRTGRVERRLTRTVADPHLQNLQFIYSTGAWSPDGRQVALATVREGRAVLTLHGTSDTVARRIELKGVDEAFHPAWSPDGQRIYFSGLSRSVSDLYAVDLATSAVTPLTNDAYGDLHPAISPDGRRLAFSTERFTTDLDRLDIGAPGLAILDLETGRVEAVSGLRKGKHVNPQWSPDGASLYFVGDGRGASDLYRVHLADGRVEQLTRLSTGISGITANSPALSVASRSGELAFGAYENDGYAVYVVDAPDRMHAVAPSGAPSTASRLLPAGKGPTAVDRGIADTRKGLPASVPDRTVSYRPDLDLESIGQPTLAVGVDRTGTFIGGGVSLLFRDLLGNHTVLTALQLDQNLENSVGAVVYQNLKHRVNWAAAAQTSRVTDGRVLTGLAGPDTARVGIREELRQRRWTQDVEGMLMYPFSRATRIEGSAGFGYTRFNRSLKTEIFDPRTGRELDEQKEDLPAFPSLKIARLRSALVYDAAAFGRVSPILGRRARLEASPTFGTLNYVEVLADGRQYVSPAEPYTLAVQGLFFGRLGSDASDSRLTALDLGYPGLVRGYDVFSIGFNESVFDQLQGTKLALLKAELRFPASHLLTLGRGSWSSPLPIEVGAFYDGGRTWGSVAGTAPAERKWIDSAGALIRIGLGYVALEWNYLKAFDRPQKGWMWQFNFLTPAF